MSLSRTFVITFFSPAFLLAQNWVEERTFVSSGVATPRIDGLLTRPVKGQWGSFVWFQIQQGYSEAYAGATYSPKPWLQLALGGGLEENKRPGRIGSYVWLGDKRTSVLVISEEGGSGFWHKIEALYAFNCFLEAGYTEERYKGSGPELKFKIPHTPVAIWVVPMFSRDPDTHKLRTNVLLGVRWTL